MKKVKTEESPVIHGFKGFDKDMKCRGFQFEEGKEYETDRAKACESGFHACEYPLDVFCYYKPGMSVYHIVEQSGRIDRNDGDSKVASTKIKIGAEIDIVGMVKAGVKFILDKVDFTNTPATNTGDRSAATNTGNRSAATNTGDQSAATNTGDRSAATNTGDQSAATNTGYESAATNTGDHSAATNTGYESAATNTGYQSAATNTGDHSAATNTGYHSAATNTGNRSAATNTGDESAATNTGDQSAATNTGNRSAATNTGYQSAATNTGNRSAATVEGKESIACGLGIKNKAMGKLGCWIVLSEWKKLKDGWHIIDIQSAQIDGKKIKADTFYELVNGKFTECE